MCSERDGKQLCNTGAGKKLEVLRIVRNVSPRQLADSTAVGYDVILRLERGESCFMRLTVAHALRICSFFGITIEVFLNTPLPQLIEIVQSL